MRGQAPIATIVEASTLKGGADPQPGVQQGIRDQGLQTPAAEIAVLMAIRARRVADQGGGNLMGG